MDIGKAFTYITEDENWVSKLGIGALLGMVPIVNFSVVGYQVQIARNVWQEKERPLPAWDDFGKFFVDGLRFTAIMIIYMLPVFIIYGVIMGTVFASALSTDPTTFDPSSGSFDPSSGLPFVMIGLSMMCIMPYSFLIYALYPMFFIQIARRQSVKSCFDFKEMWALFRAQPVNYLIVMAITFGLYMVISIALMPIYFIGILIPCFGFIITMLASGAVIVLVSAVSGHLEGQFILEGDNLTPLNNKEIDLM
jgi:hypothetical protein